MPPLIETAVRTLRLNRKVVLMLLLVPYLLVELAFNHRLLMLTSGTLDNQALRGVEIWGRIISGVGLGLLLWTFAMGRLLPKLSGLAALLLSLGLGVLCMWHAQRAAIDYWIDQAPARDKQISLALGMLAPTAALGQLHTRHGPLMGPSASEGLRLTVASLFPASALHAAQRDDLVLAWTRQMGASYGAQDMARIAPELADNAYRNLIVPPLALGLSLLFALLNLAQLVSALLRYAALVGDNYLGRSTTTILAGLTPSPGRSWRRVMVNRSKSNEGSRFARQEDHGPPSAEVQTTPSQTQPGRCRGQGGPERTQRQAHRNQRGFALAT